MDRVFKRVNEGVLAFDAIYDKVQDATNQSQKEKLEQDLKREIKKLQRLRDQIKTWMGNNEIKDKKALTEQRRLIETEMERFKACEKEMKTKAYSKEGLTNSTKLDPRAKEKQDTSNFISSMIEELDRQIESMEAEQENLQSTMKKGKKDTAKAERISDIEHHIERHKWHQDKMETILRMVENGSLAPEAVNNLQEDIKYYVESNQDVDFAEDEELYEELNLDDEENNENSLLDSMENEAGGSSLEDLAVDNASTTSNTTAIATPATGPTLSKEQPPPVSASPLTKNKSSTNLTQPASPAAANNSMKPAPMPSRGDLKYASAAASSPSTGPVHHQPAASIPAGLQPLPPPPKPAEPAPTMSKPVTAPTAPWAEKLDSLKKVSSGDQDKPSTATASNATEEKGVAQSPVTNNAAATAAAALVHYSLPPGLQDLVNSFDAARKRIGAPPPISSIAKLLESAYLNCPDATLADKPQYYHPQSPFPTPSFYPHDPLPGLDDPLILAKMDVDTLFYIFYYRQGTYQQYLAAKELKNRSWRFHKRFLTWFQRHEEPKAINSEYEQGTYRYFDFEGLWLQRRKSNFKFEYKFLEDEI
jgi:CCR4-NOT transcription complex subunit 3